MEGWVDLVSVIAARPGIEPTTAWSQVRRPNRYATKTHNVTSSLFQPVIIMENCPVKQKLSEICLAQLSEMLKHLIILSRCDKL